MVVTWQTAPNNRSSEVAVRPSQAVHAVHALVHHFVKNSSTQVHITDSRRTGNEASRSGCWDSVVTGIETTYSRPLELGWLAQSHHWEGSLNSCALLRLVCDQVTCLESFNTLGIFKHCLLLSNQVSIIFIYFLHVAYAISGKCTFCNII